MGEYVGSFGVVRQVGRGEGRDELYSASAKPSLGMTKTLEVVVDNKGPKANVGTKYGKDAVYVPAGAVVVDGYLLTEVKGSAANVALSLVDKDGQNEVALLDAATPTGDNSVNAFDGAGLSTRLSSNKYFKVSGTTTGLKAKAFLEYI